MARIRQFKLRNKTGAEFDMMRKDAFFHAPAGLGWGMSISTVPVGNSYHVTDEQVNQPAPSGEMVFAGYQQYEEFLQFCQIGGLVLCYMPISTWRYLEVYISIDKTEIDHETNRLICSVTFQSHSQWYEASRLYIPSQAVDEDAKLYDDDHLDSYAYLYNYEDTDAGGVTIMNGSLPSYFKVTFIGPTTDPEWRLYVGNTLTKSGKISASIVSGHKLVVNCVPSQYSIIEYNGDAFYLDRYKDSDWTTERFFEIPAGESMMVFTDSTQNPPEAWVEVYKRV